MLFNFNLAITPEISIFFITIFQKMLFITHSICQWLQCRLFVCKIRFFYRRFCSHCDVIIIVIFVWKSSHLSRNKWAIGLTLWSIKWLAHFFFIIMMFSFFVSLFHFHFLFMKKKRVTVGQNHFNENNNKRANKTYL